MKQLLETISYKYDDKGELKEKIVIDNIHLYRTETQFYKDNKPKAISHQLYSDEHSEYATLYVDRFMYDDKDRRCKEDRVWATGATSNIKDISYDKQGRIKELVDHSGQTLTKYTYSKVNDISLNRDGICSITTKKIYSIEPDKKPKLNSTAYLYFDECGRIHLMHINYASGKYTQISHKYNDVAKTITIHNEGNNMVTTEKLDDADRICWSVDIINDSKCRVETIDYNDNKTMSIKKRNISINNNLSIREDYDNLGNIISCKNYDDNGELTSYETYENEYDTNGNLVEVRRYENVNFYVKEK